MTRSRYGYAGRSARAPNVFYVQGGGVIYPVAALVVVCVYEAAAAAGGRPEQRHFSAHDGRVTCLALGPDRQTVASGLRVSAVREAASRSTDNNAPLN